MTTRIDSLYTELSVKYEIIKDFDFCTEVDCNRSDRFFLNKDKKCLEFLAGKEQEVSFESLELLLGNMCKTEAGVSLLPEYEEKSGLLYRRAMVSINRKLDFHKIDNVYVDISIEDNTSLIITFGNKAYHDIVKNVGKLGSETWDRIKADNVSRLTYYYNNKNLTIAGYQGSKQVLYETHEVERLTDSLQMLICSDNYLWFNGQTVYYKADYLADNDEVYMSVICDVRGESGNASACVGLKEISFGFEKGCIYLEPISTSGKDTRVYMNYKGTPAIQFYSDLENNWMDIKDSSIINMEGKFYWRLVMRTRDKVHRIILAQERQIHENI